jgi:hypothetical protein
VKLEISPKLKELLSETDQFAIPERNGVLYHYNPTENISSLKSSHISLGLDVDHKRRSMFQVNEKIIPSSVFFKVEGPVDPFYVVEL